MLILFDNGTPAPLRRALTGHTVVEAIERGWDRLTNGELIAAAEAAGFDLLLTTDKNILYRLVKETDAPKPLAEAGTAPTARTTDFSGQLGLTTTAAPMYKPFNIRRNSFDGDVGGVPT